MVLTRSVRYLPIVTVGFLLLGIDAAHPATLRQAYEHSLKSRAEVVQRRLDEEIADKRHSQAIAAMLPTLSASSTHTLREQVGGNSTASAFGQRYQHNASLTVAQPLFKGGAEYYGLKIASTSEKIAQLNRAQAEIDLYRDVATRFYDILSRESEIANLTEQDELLQKRIDFLERWVRIGRSKPTELIAVRSQKARVNADISRLQSELERERQQFVWFTSLPPEERLEDTLELPLPAIPEEWTKRVEDLPVIRAKQLEWENARRERNVARADYLPTVDVEGNYYLDRAGILRGSRWDVNLMLRWELFSGGETAAESAIQAKEMMKTEVELKDLKERSLRDFLGQKRLIEQRRDTVEKLAQAVTYAKQNYDEQQEEFKRGLISNLEVLRAMDDYLQIKQTQAREQWSLKLAWIVLNTMVGLTP